MDGPNQDHVRPCGIALNLGGPGGFQLYVHSCLCLVHRVLGTCFPPSETIELTIPGLLPYFSHEQGWFCPRLL